MEPPRKRPYTDGQDTNIAKKRALIGPNGSPRVNGTFADPQEEPVESDNLELFRKEAIFRRMKHYSREHERSQARIAELEQRKNTCEAGLAAMSACWTQLVETIRLLVKPEHLPDVHEEFFDFTKHIHDMPRQDYAKVLENNLHATQTLVTKLVQMGGEQQSLWQGEFKEHQNTTNERIALRSEIDLVRVQLQDSEAQKEGYHAALVAVESRLDRLRNEFVHGVQLPAGNRQMPLELSEEPLRKPSPPAPSKSPVHEFGVCDTMEREVLQEHIKNREAKIVLLEKEAAILMDEKTMLEAEMKQLSFERIAENPYYKAVIERSSFLESSANESREQIGRLTEEIGNLRTSRKEWEESVLAAASQANQELKTMLAKRDAENARLRDQREQQAAELNERKHREGVKLASLHEYKTLAEARSERILILESELCRHKARLAATAGEGDLMLFFVGGKTEAVDYIDNLKDRVNVAENRVAALEQTLSIFQDDHPDVVEHMKAEADALHKLSEARTQLEKYKAVYGDYSTLSPDVSQLAKQLHQKEDEIQRLKMQDTQHGHAETSLYAELDKLSAAWEALDKQVKSKVFDLANMEARVDKVGLDRAKSENKFYAAMRDKESIEAERKNLARNLDKQAKLIERLVDTERNLASQLSALEKEIMLSRKAGEVQRDKIEYLEGELGHWKARTEAEKQKLGELHRLVQEREKSAEARRHELRRLEDTLTRSNKELEQKLKAAALSSGQKVGDNETTLELLKLLKCSTCGHNFRNTVITKCMHTFCKQCIDTRISTRQRKCPVDNLPFAQSDVQTIFFQ